MTTRSPLQGNTKGFLRAAFFPFLAGFLLQFNFQPRAFGIPVDRVSILLQSGLVVILMLLLLNRRVGGRGVAFLVGAFLLFAANIMANGADLAFGYGNVDLSISVTYALSLVAPRDHGRAGGYTRDNFPEEAWAVDGDNPFGAHGAAAAVPAEPGRQDHLCP